MGKEMNFDINGVVTVPGTMTNDEFFDKFIDFVESIGGSFGGGIMQVDDEGNPIPEESE